MLRRIAQQIEHLRIRLLLGDEMESAALRQIFKERYGIEVGLYSFGCFDRWRIAPGTRIGRYSSIARTVHVIRSNHPTEALTTHPYLYDPSFGVVSESKLSPGRVEIGDDVWMGHYAVTTAGCTRIGRGAVVGAGAVVTKDVPPYAIVTGVPGRVARFRFPPDVIAAIEATRWWEMSKSELKELVRSRPDAVFKPAAEKLREIAAR